MYPFSSLSNYPDFADCFPPSPSSQQSFYLEPTLSHAICVAAFDSKECHNMNTNLAKMPARRPLKSGELDVFDATLYFSGSFDHISTDFPVGMCSSEKSLIKTIPPPYLSQFTKAEKVVRDKKRIRPPISPGAKLASVVSSIFHQTKSKSKSANTPRVPKPLKDEEVEGHGWGQKGGIRSNAVTSPRLVTPKNILKELRSHDSYKASIEVPQLVLETKSSEKNKAFGHVFVEYRGILNKDTNEFLRDDRIWVIEMLRRSYCRVESQAEDEDGDCVQSICSSDLFELENYDVGGLSGCLPVYGLTDKELIKKNLVVK